MSANFTVENDVQKPAKCCSYDKKDNIRMRKKVRRLYFDPERELSKRAIADRVGMSRNFVNKWTQSKDQDVTEDDRGWPKGKRRKWTKHTEQRITQLRSYLEEDPREFYWGATAISQEWHRRFPDESVPPLRTIGQILKDLDLADHTTSGKGAARYLCYPEHTIYEQMSNRLLETDFVGQKYLRGRTEPLHFIGFCFKKPPKLRVYQRISAQTTDNLTDRWNWFFDQYEKPDYAKIDNAAAAIGSASGKRNLSRAMVFLLERGICPIFSVPRKPFSQASIEGNNSVFAKKFWNRREFCSVEDVDRQLQWFNDASIRYTAYEASEPQRQQQDEFEPKVYFLRQVRENSEDNTCPSINVLNETVPLPEEYLNLFVLAEWDIRSERLSVKLEKNKDLESILSVDFAINEHSRKRLESSGALSSCI